MLRIQATIGLTTYYFASEALDYADRYWEPRISNAFQITREFNSADKSGNKIRTVDVSLDNRDGFFNSIYTADGLVNGKFVLYFNEGDNVVKTFTGKVNKINSVGDDVSLTIREVGYEYLTRKFPDAQIAYDYYSTSGINESWNAIPIHFGTVNRYPCPWVNLFESHFIIGSGPIHAVKKIYFDKTVVYDSSTGKNGYKPTPESPEIKFRIFKGVRAGQTDVVDGITSPYPGFAFIQLYKIVNSVEEPADPVNPDGEAVQIYVDIEGIQNEAGDAPERNPAQILYQCFTKPYTAEEGYGLAIPAADLDFTSAITECGIQGFKIDGSIDNTTEFGEWVDEILRCCRGQLYENNGKISVRIDAAAAAPSIHFDETGELGYNCIVDTWTEPERDAQTNRVRLSYSWNFENSNFNKKPSYNQESPLGDTHLQNQTHATRIQKWNTETLEYKLIKDDTTAHKLAQYYLNNIVKQLITTSLTTEVDIPNTVDAGTVVKVTSPKYGWSEKQFRITSISRSEENTEIQLKEYDSSIFTFYDPGTGAETSDNQYSVYNIPNKPEMSSLTVVNELLADGSTQTRVNVTFVKPTENAQFIALYYKLSSEPESSFRILDTTTDATQMSVIWKGIESGVYNFRLAAISSVGIYSDLGIVSGDKHYYGQPNTETSVTMTGDTIAPGTPTITNLTPTLGGVAFTLEIAGGVPSDFSHFEIYRTVGTGSEAIIDNNHTTLLFTDNERMAAYEGRKYAAIAVDKTGNKSSKSTISGSTVPLKIDTADIFAGAITSDKITTNQIVAKDYRTACNAGCVGGNIIAGVLFNSTGIEAWSCTAKTFYINAATGDVSMTGTITALAGLIGGFTIDPTEGLYAGAGTTRVQMKAGAGFWAGATAQVDAPFSVDQTGALKSTSGHIGGWDITSTAIIKTDIDGVNNRKLDFNSQYASAHYWHGNASSGAFLGQVYNNGWTGRYGLAVVKDNVSLFESSYDNAGNVINQIAGWNFTSEFLCKSSGESIVKLMSGDYVGRTGLEVYSSLMSISIGHCLHHPNVAYCAMDGILIADASAGNLFKVGKYHSDCSLVAQIAGWNFNASCLYSLIGSYGQMRLDSSNRTIWMFPDSSGASRFTLGQCIYTFDTWKSVDMGLALTGAACENLFTVWGCCGVTCANIAGWNFDDHALCKGMGTALLSINSRHPNEPASHPFLWLGDGSGAHHVTVGGSHFAMGWTHGRYGIQVVSAGVPVFTAYACCDGSGSCFNIAGWNFNKNALWKSIAAGSAAMGYPGIYIGACHDGIETIGTGFRFMTTSNAHPLGEFTISIGECLIQPYVTTHNRKGMQISSATSGMLFRTDTAMDDSDICAQIAGWCFDCKMFKTGTFGCGPSFIISRENTGSGYFYLGQQVLQGYSMIWHHGANAGHLVIGQIAANTTTIKTDYYGLQMMDNYGQEFFALAAKQGCLCYEPYNRIAGWVFDSQNIYKIYGDSRIQISSAVGSFHRYINSNPNYGEFLGQIYNNGWTSRYGFAVTRGAGNYYFRVDTDINGANHCSQIAGWDFNNSQIFSAGCGLILCATGAIQTGDFVTGNKGWKIDCNGNAEFNNICARGAIRTAVFIKDQISVVGGCQLVRPASVTCADSIICNYYSILFENTDQFEIDDIIRIKDGLNDFWGRVGYKDAHGINANYMSGTQGWTSTKGQAVVNYGPANSGGIMLNGQAPYIDLYTHDGAPWNGTCSRVRIGNLNGWGDISSNVYGFAIGTPTGNYLRYDSTSSELKLRGVMNIQAGSTMPSSLLNNFSISCNYCQWTTAYGYDSRFIYCSLTMPDGTIAAGDTLVASYNSEVLSDIIEIDPTQAYKLTLSIWASATTGLRYFGITAFDKNLTEVPLDHFDSAGNFAGNFTNPYFWAGSTSGWTELEGYIMPSSTWQENIPKGKNVSYNFRFPASTKYIRMRYLNYYNNGVQTIAHFFSPSVVPVSVEGTYKINRGLSANGTLISSVAPACNAAPSGAGLYLGANVMGYYDGGTWKSYMDNSGRFYLSGTTGGLAWDGSTLTTCGTVCSTAGHIGGWCIDSTRLYCQNPDTSFLSIGDWAPNSCGHYSTIYIANSCNSSDCGLISIGHCLQIGGEWYSTLSGISIVGKGSSQLFRVTSDRATGNNLCAQIAGWDFGSWYLYANNGVLYGCGLVNITLAKNTVFGDSAITPMTTGGSLQGLHMTSYHGTWPAYGWRVGMGAIGAGQFYEACTTGEYGLEAVWSCNSTGAWVTCPIFTIAMCPLNGAYRAQIAGWNFNANCLYSNNIIINNNGSIYSNNYSAGSAGWYINGSGNAEFNNVTVRGTVCASQGCIGCFVLDNGRLKLTADDSFDGLVFCRNFGSSCISIFNNLIWMCTYGAGYLACSTFNASSLSLHKYPDSFTRDSYFDAGLIFLTTHMVDSPYSSVCSSIYICSFLNGVDAANAAFAICTYGGNTCYAMCTNGQIVANGVCAVSYLHLPSIGAGIFGVGTGDGASFSTYNTYLSGWNGMAFINQSAGGAYPYGVVGLLDFRNGHLCMKGTIYGNCLHSGFLYAANTQFNIVYVGINCISSRGLLKIVGSHTSTIQHITATKYSDDATHADMFLWASEPNKTYSGTGISNNYYYHDGLPYNDWTRKDTARGGSFIRLLDGDIKFNIITSAGNIYDILALSDGNNPIDANNTVANGFYYANANVSLYGRTEGGIYNQANSTNLQGQIYQDYRTGQLAVRGKCNGTWTPWLCIATNGCRIIGCATCCAIVGNALSGGVCGVVAMASTYGLWAGAGNIGIYAEAGTNYAIKACAYSCYGVFATASCCYGIVGCVVACYGVLGCAALSGVYGVATTAYPVAGNGAYYNASTRTLKQNFEDVCVLTGLRSLCIQKWTWADINQRGFDEFIAPPAEDVASAFGLTFKDDGYYTLDGIALKAAQEIDENVQVIDQNVQLHDTCIEFLKDENISLKSCIEQMSCKMKMIEERLGIN